MTVSNKFKMISLLFPFISSFRIAPLIVTAPLIVPFQMYFSFSSCWGALCCLHYFYSRGNAAKAKVVKPGPLDLWGPSQKQAETSKLVKCIYQLTEPTTMLGLEKGILPFLWQPPPLVSSADFYILLHFCLQELFPPELSQRGCEWGIKWSGVSTVVDFPVYFIRWCTGRASFIRNEGILAGWPFCICF